MARAHLILCHSNADFLIDLFRYIYRDEDVFILHADAKSPESLTRTVSLLSKEFSNVYPISPEYCSWGGYSLVDVTFKAFQVALIKNSQWSHFSVLSEHHIPLLAPDAIDATLVDGISYFVTYPMASFQGEGLADLEQRFERRFRELPGVGSFPDGIRTSSISPSAIYHAHQWVILARAACEQILDLFSFQLQDTFRTSLLSDETAIATAFMQADSLPREDRSTTYIAYPHLTDNADQVISDSCFVGAVASGMLYARKRPKSLTAAMQAHLEPMAKFTDAELKARLFRRQHIEVNATIIKRIREHIRRQEVVLEPVHGNYVAAIYISVSTSSYPDGLRTYVISENKIDFKICSCFNWLSEQRRNLITADGYESTMLRVRLNDLHSWNEIHLNTNTQSDFFAINWDGAFAAMVRAIEQHIDYAESLTGRAQ
jgi:hypothetical protein